MEDGEKVFFGFYQETENKNILCEEMSRENAYTLYITLNIALLLFLSAGYNTNWLRIFSSDNQKHVNIAR